MPKDSSKLPPFMTELTLGSREEALKVRLPAWRLFFSDVAASGFRV